jgi:hypothetical protein
MKDTDVRDTRITIRIPEDLYREAKKDDVIASPFAEQLAASRALENMPRLRLKKTIGRQNPFDESRTSVVQFAHPTCPTLNSSSYVGAWSGCL